MAADRSRPRARRDRATPEGTTAPGYGEAMRALSPRHRSFVTAYCSGETLLGAYELAGYKVSEAAHRPNGRGPGSAARKSAHELARHPAVAAAIVEECRRLLAFSLPGNVRLMQQIAEGRAEAADPRGAPPWPVQAKMLTALASRSGLAEIVQHEHKVEVEQTTLEMFAELIKLGKNPDEVLRNLPEDERRQVLELTRGEYREIAEGSEQ